MNTKHTPGPWMATIHNHIKCDLRPIGLTADAGQTLAAVFGGPTSDLSFPQSEDEVTSNARLIAAAPDLLEALQTLVQMTGNIGQIEAFLNGPARAVIAKSTGTNA